MEYFPLCRFIRGKVKKYLENYKHRRLVTTAERTQSLRKCRREVLLYHPIVTALRREDGHRVTDRTEVEKEVCKKSYMKLFARHMSTFQHLNFTMQQAHSVLISELRNATFQMKNVKARGNDGINIELVKAGGHEL